MKVKVTCWVEWGDKRDCGYNAYGTRDIVENIELEVKDRSEISKKLTDNGFGHTNYKILSAKLN